MENTMTVGIFVRIKSYFCMICAKYANVNAKILIFNGKFLDNGPVFVRDSPSHTPLGFLLFVSAGSTFPITMVKKQLKSNMAKNIIPLMSELKRDEIAKNDTSIKGASRNPTYSKDCTFNNSTIYLYIADIYK